MVYALLYTIRQNGCAQVLWDVIFISVPDPVLFSFRLCPRLPLVSLVSSICVCFELSSVLPASVQTDVRYMPSESNHTLSPPHFLEGKLSLWDVRQNDGVAVSRPTLAGSWDALYSVPGSAIPANGQNSRSAGGGSNHHGILGNPLVIHATMIRTAQSEASSRTESGPLRATHPPCP